MSRNTAAYGRVAGGGLGLDYDASAVMVAAPGAAVEGRMQAAPVAAADAPPSTASPSLSSAASSSSAAAAAAAALGAPTALTFLCRSRHPVAALAHIAFKALAAALYLAGVPRGFVASFITVTLLLAADFWLVKNVTGRVLVGMRWWARTRADTGETEWAFETRAGNAAAAAAAAATAAGGDAAAAAAAGTAAAAAASAAAAGDAEAAGAGASALDARIFWTALYAAPALFALSLFLHAASLSLSWALVDAVALGLLGANLVGYFRCSGEAQRGLRAALQAGISGALAQAPAGAAALGAAAAAGAGAGAGGGAAAAGGAAGLLSGAVSVFELFQRAAGAAAGEAAAAAAAAAPAAAGSGGSGGGSVGNGISDLDAVSDPFGYTTAPTPNRPGLRPMPRYELSETVPI
jgi:hypothetical protein